MKTCLLGSTIKLTGLSDGAMEALEESVYGLEVDADMARPNAEVFTRTRTTATIPVDVLEDMVDGLQGHADFIEGDWIIDSNVEISEEFEAAVRARKLKCIARLQKALKRYNDPIEAARKAIVVGDTHRIEGPRMVNLLGEATQVLAIAFGDDGIGDIIIVRRNGGVQQFLHGEWTIS